ncbi:hypothetical protein [Ornithinimicrobium pratense]|uniref:Uncharacterized protein n=1 Tax=Ornithinimicrobium pratense TaxID=2593973 RepID=A0A5J6V2X2_9MICO|nr:hypothetical protein [Ornithinimicrobium pratense]QFG67664.1 hypothetical protein FY030_02005 [Ornithinimicrobium pratense]
MSTSTGRSPEEHPGQQGRHEKQAHQGQATEGAPQPQPQPQQQAPRPPGTAGPAATTTTSTRDVVRIVLHVLALILVVLGISLDLDDRGGGLWSDTWTWAGFATLMALAQIAALLPRSAASGAGWTIGAVGAGGLLLFWTLLMLPMISTNMAFLVTLGTACAVAGVLLSPDRRV